MRLLQSSGFSAPLFEMKRLDPITIGASHVHNGALETGLSYQLDGLWYNADNVPT